MQFTVQLNDIEARVFGVLIEKALSTPEHYPLSVAAVTTAANQRTNRNPVMDCEEPEIAEALDSLVKKFLVRRVWLTNSRVEKFAHNAKDALGLDPGSLAVLAELLLRGPQTPGELRTHVSRMVPVTSLESLHAMMQPLLERGLVKRLPPAPGSRAERYCHTMTSVASPPADPISRSDDANAALREQVEELAARLAQAERQIRRLAQAIGMSLEALARAGREESDQGDPF